MAGFSPAAAAAAADRARRGPHRRGSPLQRGHVLLEPIHLLRAGVRVDRGDADQRFLERRNLGLELRHARDAIRDVAPVLAGERGADVGTGGGGRRGRRGRGLDGHALDLDSLGFGNLIDGKLLE